MEYKTITLPEYKTITLSNNSQIVFFTLPLNQLSVTPDTKNIPTDLKNVLLNPNNYQSLHLNNEIIDKIFLGFSTDEPENKKRPRLPLWISPELISSHILIGGSIGSGKTSLTYRLIAGALNTFGTVIIGEAKGGFNGGEEGAAFTNLATYLSRQLKVNHYRWVRGNCWFNPLLYLNNKRDRKAFMLTLSQQIQTGGGELDAYIQRAANIATLILEFLVSISVNEQIKQQQCTLRQLVNFLKRPEELEATIGKFTEKINSQKMLAEITNIKRELERLNFFKIPQESDRFIMTVTGLNFLIDLLDNEDLLYYTEYHQQGLDGQQLCELKIDDILYNRSLVVISQPLSDPTSKIVGSLFWDTLLNRILELGATPAKQNGKSREKVAVFLDETHRLPVGRLGNSGDFLRQYNVGLIEITPTVVDHQRWEQNKHIYQSIISLSPGVKEVVQLMQDRLPNYQQPPFQLSLDYETGVDGTLQLKPKVRQTIEQFGQDNPGVSLRSLQQTGKYTALLQSNLIPDAHGLFWIDLETELLGSNFDTLMKDAISGDNEAIRVANYALGLVTYF